MKAPASPRIHHHVDPMRYPKVQKEYEGKGKNAFNAVKLFGDVVETMVEIQKKKMIYIFFVTILL